MPGRLEGRVAVVTGGASGQGRGTCLRFASEGADVVVTDVNTAGGEATAKEVRELGRRALFVEMDVGSEAQTEAMAETTLRELGRLDAFVHAAAIPHANAGNPEWDGKRLSLVDTPIEDWDRVMRVNLTGTWLVNRAVARRMIAAGNGGSIVNIGSNGMFQPMPFNGDYCASKAGAWMLSRCLALELAQHRIRVNMIAPGLIDTPMAVTIRTEAGRRRWNETIPLGRVGKPSDIANAALFFVSDESCWITGKFLSVDGGLVDLPAGMPPDAYRSLAWSGSEAD